MKARLTALTAALALATSALATAARAEPTAESSSARARASQVTWAYVSSKQPKKAFYKKKTALPVGRSGGSVHRAYFQVDLSDVVGEDIISSVRLRVPVRTPSPCRKGGAPAVKVQTTRYLTAKATWNKQPKALRTLGVVKPKCAGKVLEIDLTKAARKVQNDGGTDLTLRLSATNEKKAGNFLRLSPSAKLAVRAYSNGGDGGPVFGDPGKNKPQDVANASFNGAACAGGAGPEIEKTTATFGGTVADADGGFLGLRVQWEAVGGDGGMQDSKMQFSEPNEPRAFAVTLPTGSFAKDGLYRWRLQGFDDVGAGEWTGWCQFTVDLPLPVEDIGPDPARIG